MKDYQSDRHSLAPICLFTYNRISETRQTLEALSHNFLASQSELFIFSDGPKNESDEVKVKAVRKYVKKVSGFGKVTISESDTNKGLADSIIEGVTEVISEYGKVIVLEDDLITAPNFLDFMNQALVFYKNNHRVHSVSGYSMELNSLKDYSRDYYLGFRATSWGWGTWKDKWENIDWEVTKFNRFRYDLFQQMKFMRGGSDLPGMLKDQMKGKIDSWAIRWCFDQFLNDQLTVFPKESKVKNIGFGEYATHTKKSRRFNTFLDEGTKREFSFDKNILVDEKLLKEFRNKFSFIQRLMDKIHR